MENLGRNAAQAREGTPERRRRILAVDQHAVRPSRRPFFPAVDGQAIPAVEMPARRRQQQVRKVAVEQYRRPCEVAQERDHVRHAVAEDDVVAAAARQGRGTARHARDGARRAQPLADLAGQKAAVHAHVQRPVARLVEAASRIVMGREEDDTMAAREELHRRIHHQTLRAAEAQVRMQKGDSQRSTQPSPPAAAEASRRSPPFQSICQVAMRSPASTDRSSKRRNCGA